MAPWTIDDVEVAGKRVLMRVDFNVPLDADGAITDDRRIRQALPSIESVLRRDGRLILMSHLGRPAGTGFEPALGLRPVAARLGELLDERTVRFVEGSCTGPEASEAVAALAGGEVLVLDNLRFDPGEKSGDATFAQRVAEYGDLYCNDAFGTAHRADASMVAVPAAMSGRPRVAGLLMARELRYLAGVLGEPQRPFLAILGGAKVSDKLAAIRNLAGQVDAILIGGAMAYTFLKSRGINVGSSRVEPTMLNTAAEILDEAGRVSIRLPEDHRCGREISSDTPVETCTEIPDGWMGLDIGPVTARRYADLVREARTIIWNGPMGVFETPPFDAGSRCVAEAMAAATDAGAVTIAGGGETAAALEAFGCADRLSHVSTGGGASLQMLEGRRFRSVELLDRAPPGPGA